MELKSDNDSAVADRMDHDNASAPSPDNGSDLRRLQLDAKRHPGSSRTWRALGRELRSRGNGSEAAAAFGRSITASLADRELTTIENWIRTGKHRDALRALEERLKAEHDDVVALRLSGDLAAQTGRVVDAEYHYRRAIDLYPNYIVARHGLTRLLLRQARLGDAANEAERMLAIAPTDPMVRTLKAAVAANVGDHDDAASLYEGLIGELPQHAALWLGLGHSERTLGRAQAAIAAYRHALDIPSGTAEAYWSLSNLKTYRFAEDDLHRIDALAATATGQEAAYINFALGQAFDARDEPGRAFAYFARGNAAKRTLVAHDAIRAEQTLEHWTASITSDLLAGRSTEGDPSSAPIFIVGLPRSGSTLVEQILASHSLVENTAELPYMDRIASRLARRGMKPGQERANLDLDGVDLPALGREYLAAARAHRKTAKPYFIDKMPGNFAHSGLIRLMLPNARIIDVRRHPLATAWSVFKQLFAHGQPFAYDLAEIARWYRSYVAAMERFHAIMPGAVFTLRYEDLVDDTEAQLRRLLDHIGVAFEPGCLAFYESGNAVRTPSSEQVRRPVFREGLESWQRYREHLAPAAALLAAELAAYGSARPARDFNARQ